MVFIVTCSCRGVVVVLLVILALLDHEYIYKLCINAYIVTVIVQIIVGIALLVIISFCYILKYNYNTIFV